MNPVGGVWDGELIFSSTHLTAGPVRVRGSELCSETVGCDLWQWVDVSTCFRLLTNPGIGRACASTDAHAPGM
jgi:hypothetical protein